MKVVKLTKSTLDRVARILEKGKIVCFPTDTIYGLLALASDREAVEKLFSIRRPSGRPFLLLIPDAGWIETLGLLASYRHIRLIENFNATFILYKGNSLPLYLTRGRKSLAVRIPPANSHVRELLEYLSVPVVAPSANPEGQKPATSVREAIEYFGDRVDLYVDGGKRDGKPSTIVRLLYPKGIRLVREGSIPFEDIRRAYRAISSSLPEDVLSEFSSLDPFEPGLFFPPPR